MINKNTQQEQVVMPEEKMMSVNITERGYAGHLIISGSCLFRRNTLIEYGDKRIVVSTVGDYDPGKLPDSLSKYTKDVARQIGVNRYYETMAFWAKYKDPYWEADVERGVEFESPWFISELKRETDKKADEMHDAVVRELSEKIKVLMPEEKWIEEFESQFGTEWVPVNNGQLAGLIESLDSIKSFIRQTLHTATHEAYQRGRIDEAKTCEGCREEKTKPPSEL